MTGDTPEADDAAVGPGEPMGVESAFGIETSYTVVDAALVVRLPDGPADANPVLPDPTADRRPPRPPILAPPPHRIAVHRLPAPGPDRWTARGPAPTGRALVSGTSRGRSAAAGQSAARPPVDRIVAPCAARNPSAIRIVRSASARSQGSRARSAIACSAKRRPRM